MAGVGGNCSFVSLTDKYEIWCGVAHLKPHIYHFKLEAYFLYEAKGVVELELRNA